MISLTIGQIKRRYSTDALFSSNAFNSFWSMSGTTHDYAGEQCGVDYVFEVIDGGTKAYMTGQGKGIKPHDYIMLRIGTLPQRYQVEMIDYYEYPSDMWIALLRPNP